MRARCDLQTNNIWSLKSSEMHLKNNNTWQFWFYCHILSVSCWTGASVPAKPASTTFVFILFLLTGESRLQVSTDHSEADDQ